MNTIFIVSWLDSTYNPSNRHLTEDGENTLCGYPFAENIRIGRWTFHRVKKTKGKKFCPKCMEICDGFKHKPDWLDWK